MDLLKTTVANIKELNVQVMEEIRKHQANLTKPAGSLGVLEDISIQIGGITGKKFPEIQKKAVVVMAGDHGVTDENVSAYPKQVTPQMVLNFTRGGAAINVLARHAGAHVVVVDVGVAVPIESEKVLTRKVKPGTANIAKGPAMSREEAVQAVEVGISIAENLVMEGFQLLATGEMGIGNTTASSAIMATLLGINADEVTGRGTGLDPQSVFHKAQIIDQAIEINKPDPRDPIDVLAKVGGLEICGLVGLILGGAANRIPIVIDGFISTTAALIASKISPKSLQYMVASHCSAERAHRKLLQYLKLKPMLELEMRLGEGTGAVMAFHLIEASLKIVKEMATFESAGVSQG